MSEGRQPITKQEYERAFNELAAFLLTQYKKKKQADLTSDQILDRLIIIFRRNILNRGE